MYVNIYDSKIVLHIQFKHTKHRDIKYQLNLGRTSHSVILIRRIINYIFNNMEGDSPHKGVLQDPTVTIYFLR